MVLAAPCNLRATPIALVRPILATKAESLTWGLSKECSRNREAASTKLASLSRNYRSSSKFDVQKPIIVRKHFAISWIIQ